MINKKNCCGCGLCSEICPSHAISFIRDNEGFYYPNIDSSCLNCGLCLKYCPVNKNKVNNSVLKTFYGFIKDTDILLRCSSGGIAYALSKYIVNKGGVVFGAIYCDGYKKVTHITANNLEEIAPMIGSKYIKSNIVKSFKRIKSYLEEDGTVLFIGLPCDIGAVKAYLNKDYINLYTCELICNGVTSEKVQEEYIENIESNYNSKLTDFTVRYKKGKWKPKYIRGIFSDGSKMEVEFNGTDFERAFRILKRPSCYNCFFKGSNSIADMTIGDYWGIKETDNHYNKNGVSVVFCNTDKGSNMIINNPYIETYEINYEEGITNNPSIYKSTDISIWRASFIKNLHKYGLHKAVQRTGVFFRKIKSLLKIALQG